MATRLTPRTTPFPATVTRNGSRRTVNPYGFSCFAYQRAAPAAAGEPAARIGYSVANCLARAAAASLSKADGRLGGWSGAGRETEKASTSRGRPTSSHVPR